MKPPYNITSKIVRLIASISEKIGEVNSAHLYKAPTELRKKNKIKTIQSSLEIEGNTLSVVQITALLEDKRILAPKKDILEVKNAIRIYNKLQRFDPFSYASLCTAHKILMSGLIERAGVIRSEGDGIVKVNKLAHIAPPGKMVKALLNDLLKYLKISDELLLIKSCVFHYEFEFIHPFMDGNGRMGRLWQTLILSKYSPVFEFLPVERLIKQRQNEYYKALSDSDKKGNSTIFVEFMLGIINESLEELLKTQSVNISGSDRIVLFKEKIKGNWFSRQDYLRDFKEISAPTASRDLKEAVQNKIVKKAGDKRTTRYKFK